MTVPKVSPTLSIHIETDRKGPNGVPLVVFPAGEQPIVRAKVVFDNPKDNIRGGDVTINFDATIETRVREGGGIVPFIDRKGTLDRREWKMTIDSPKPGYIAQGTHSKSIELTLKPNWPCSYEQLEHPVFGWVRYRLLAFVNTKSSGFFAQMTRTSAEQEFWAILPGTDVLGSAVPREVHIPMSGIQELICSIPSNRLYLGQIVPFVFRFEPPPPPLQPNEYQSTGAWTIEKGSIVLKQYSHYYGGDKDTIVKTASVVVAKVPLQADWPMLENANEAWERVVYMAVPEIEKATASFTSRYLDVRHKIKIDAVIRSSNSPKPLTWKHKFDVHISGVEVPLPPIGTVNASEQLPEYSTGSYQVNTRTEKS
ncbi:hypothetical protein BGW42_007489 [Actinomortierella wolfii]|nr:hypothetical protein BGW42_007489 [Actinomortierella wolfii]